ncbi:MAG: hypothetical protein ACI9V1_001577 [Spirosomataceae bacterium]|jgi:hypothetical protein
MNNESEDKSAERRWNKYYLVLVVFLVVQIFGYYLFTQYFK